MRSLLVAFLVVCAACNPGRQEARSLIAAVDRYRKAENPDKPGLADEIEKVPCTDDEVCAAKDACVKTASLNAKALRKQREAEALIAQVLDASDPKTDPSAKTAASQLDEVDRLTHESEDALAACDEKLAALRVKSR